LLKRINRNIKIFKRAVLAGVIVTVVIKGVILPVHADIIILKSKEQIKGVVVEDYKDRIIVSTIDGEREIMRQDIKKMTYDMEEQNLTNLGDLYQDKGSYNKAYYYYSKALEVNPDYKRAKDGLSYVGTYLQQTSRRLKLDQLERANEESQWQKRRTGVVELSKEEKLERYFGFSIKESKGKFEVRSIKLGSSAAKSGLKKGDVLLEAWGRSVSYMQPEEVMDKLLIPGIMDLQITVERAYRLKLDQKKGKYNILLGGKLGFSEMEGLIFEEVYPEGPADRAGVEKGDVVASLEGNPTRYMSLEEAADIIMNSNDESLLLKIKRNIVMWKNFKKK